MNTNRRDFLKQTSLALGALALPGNWIADAAMLEPGMSTATKRELATMALKTARDLGASYADIRINRYRSEHIQTREKRVLQVGRNQSFGFGVRLLYKGAWGFAARLTTLVHPRQSWRQAWRLDEDRTGKPFGCGLSWSRLERP